MATSNDSQPRLRPDTRLKSALLALTGIGAGSMMVADKVDAQGVGEVKTSTVAAPKTARIAVPQKWQRVQIALTPEQQAQLAKLGVNTVKLDITTYKISQLGGRVVN